MARSVFMMSDQDSQTLALTALDMEYFRAHGEHTNSNYTVTVRHAEDEVRRITQIVTTADPAAQRY
jgi:hypothetical protein